MTPEKYNKLNKRMHELLRKDHVNQKELAELKKLEIKLSEYTGRPNTHKK